MGTVEKALQTQLNNIQAKTGKTLEQLFALIKSSGLVKHGEIRDMLKRDLGLGHGDANTLTVFALKAETESAPAAPDSAVNEIYTGPKAALRPIHDKLMAAIQQFGTFEVSPKKTYLSLRRKKQFAMIGPATNTRVEVGINLKDVPATDRLILLPPGGMCQYKVKATDVSEVDQELLGWIRHAFDHAG